MRRPLLAFGSSARAIARRAMAMSQASSKGVGHASFSKQPLMQAPPGGLMAAMIDTSGSVDHSMLRSFLAEVHQLTAQGPKLAREESEALREELGGGESPAGSGPLRM